MKRKGLRREIKRNEEVLQKKWMKKGKIGRKGLRMRA